MTVSIMLVYDGMLDLAARMKLQAFDRGFIDSQFLLNVAGRNDEFLKKGTRTAGSFSVRLVSRMRPQPAALGDGGRTTPARNCPHSGCCTSSPRRPGGCGGRLSSCSYWRLVPV